jgi:hypothetical protein
MEQLEPPSSSFWCRRRAAELAPLLQPASAVKTPEDAAELFVRLSGHPGVRGPVAAACALVCGGGPGAAAAKNAAGAQPTRGRPDVSLLPRLFDAIGRWALAALAAPGAEQWMEAPWAAGGGARRRAFTAAECRGVLANVLLLNAGDPVGRAGHKPRSKCGGLRLDRCMLFCPGVGAHKLAALLQYFATGLELEGTADDAREVVFERRAGHCDLAAFRAEVLAAPPPSVPLAAAIALQPGGMEAAVGTTQAFVNFANPVFGYGEFIPSCTQEEILQVCAPEFNVGMLFIGNMAPHEVVAVHGCRRYAAYTGYLHRFEFAGRWEADGGGVQSILTMDACTQGHFRERSVLRDVQKAALCFRGLRSVSTGRWGCGVFGGTPAHKFAQQLAAAALSGERPASLQFSTFGTPDGCDAVLAAVAAAEAGRGRPISAGQLLTALLACEGCTQQNFVPRFVSALAPTAAAAAATDAVWTSEPSAFSGGSDEMV